MARTHTISMLIGGILWLAAVSDTTAQSSAPDSISYQGYLEQNGTAYNNPSAMLTFRLFTGASGGSAIWTETQTGVSVADGVFSVVLGSIVDLSNVSFEGSLWVSVAVGDASALQLTPRTALTASPYALNLRGLRVRPVASKTVNLMGGFDGNTVRADVQGAVIGGGGDESNTNQVRSDFGTVAGGSNNVVGNDAGPPSGSAGATVGGGKSNIASAGLSTVAGGNLNSAIGAVATVGGGVSNTAGSVYTTVAGGWSNLAGSESATVGGGYSNRAEAKYSVVAGGGPTNVGDPDNTRNRACDNYGTIGGGGGNQAGSCDDGDVENDWYATVGGGHGNVASGGYATISGGYQNVADATWTVVAGGKDNVATVQGAVVAGGSGNKVTQQWSTIGGGSNNEVSGSQSVIGGGKSNTVSGSFATIPGGHLSAARGDGSFAAGTAARANHEGSFAWGDRSTYDAGGGTDSLITTGPHQFLIRATGGVGIGNNSPQENLHITSPTQGSAIFLGGNGGQGPNGIVFDDDTEGAGLQLFFRTDPNQLVLERASTGTGSNAADAMYYDRDDDLFYFTNDVTVAGTFSNPSDRRLKTDVRPSSYGLREVLALNPVSFRWGVSADDGPDIGLIAQEVENVVPEAVVPPSTSNEYYGISYTKLIPVLIKAVQDQQEEIETLRARLDLVEGGSSRTR